MVRRKSMKVDDTAKESLNIDDRITRLPNDVIHQIYSYLDSRYCVQSSLLSRTWRNTWKSHPHLKFETDPYTTKKFPNFGHRFLSGRDQNAEISTIDFRSKSIPLRLLKEIVTYAISHKTQNLNIEYLNGIPTRRGCLETSLFKSHFLQCLYLNIDFELEKPPNLTWDLPSLNTLHLEKVTFTTYPLNNDGKKSLDLFSNFSKLKTLVLLNCRVWDIKIFYITSTGLENLTINFLHHSCEFVISAPKLSSFTYDRMSPSLLSANDLESLETVTFRTVYNSFIGNQPNHIEFVIKSLHQLYNAKYLTLNTNALLFLWKSLRLHERKACPFVKLESLTLDEMPPFPVDFADIVSYFRSGSPGCIVCVEYDPTSWSSRDMDWNKQVVIRSSPGHHLLQGFMVDLAGLLVVLTFLFPITGNNVPVLYFNGMAEIFTTNFRSNSIIYCFSNRSYITCAMSHRSKNLNLEFLGLEILTMIGTPRSSIATSFLANCPGSFVSGTMAASPCLAYKFSNFSPLPGIEPWTSKGKPPNVIIGSQNRELITDETEKKEPGTNPYKDIFGPVQSDSNAHS
ncbi:hypothetical protein LXL04_010626 [Taraxacum kok-saghyz]